MTGNLSLLVPTSRQLFRKKCLNSHLHTLSYIQSRAAPVAGSGGRWPFLRQYVSRHASDVITFTRSYTSKMQKENSNQTSVPSERSGCKDLLVVIVLMALLLSSKSLDDDYRQIRRVQTCQRSLKVIEENLQRDPDALTEEEKAYVGVMRRRQLTHCSLIQECPGLNSLREPWLKSGFNLSGRGLTASLGSSVCGTGSVKWCARTRLGM